MRVFGVAAAVAIVCACLVGSARADVAAIANDGTAPWASGVEVTSPLEAAAGAIATTIARRPVSIRCESEPDWTTLAGLNRFEPASVLGFVSFAAAGPADFAELSPSICDSLEAFAAAPAKPTKCEAVKRVPRTTVRTVRKKVGRHVVIRTIRTVTYAEVPQGTPGPCFAGGRELSGGDSFWSAYFSTAEALQTLVHESIHLQGDASEAEAECYGMQWISYAAQQLGDTPDDAAAIAQYYATQLYPQRRTQSPTYWSADCVQNGALDLTPNDGVWP